MQPVTQGLCQMSCKNPLITSSPVLAASEGQKERESGQGVTANTFQLVGSFHLPQMDGKAT